VTNRTMNSWLTWGGFISGFIAAIITQIITQVVQRRVESYSIGRAIAVEIRHIQRELMDYLNMIEMEIGRSGVVIHAPLGEFQPRSSNNVPLLMIREKDTEVFTSNLSKLGVMNAAVSSLLVEYYRAVRLLSHMSEIFGLNFNEESMEDVVRRTNTLFERCKLLEELTIATRADGDKLIEQLSRGVIDGVFLRPDMPVDHFESSFRKKFNEQNPTRIKHAIRISESRKGAAAT
jgi:hypothetical protein